MFAQRLRMLDALSLEQPLEHRNATAARCPGRGAALDPRDVTRAIGNCEQMRAFAHRVARADLRFVGRRPHAPLRHCRRDSDAGSAGSGRPTSGRSVPYAVASPTRDSARHVRRMVGDNEFGVGAFRRALSATSSAPSGRPMCIAEAGHVDAQQLELRWTYRHRGIRRCHRATGRRPLGLALPGATGPSSGPRLPRLHRSRRSVNRLCGSRCRSAHRRARRRRGRRREPVRHGAGCRRRTPAARPSIDVPLDSEARSPSWCVSIADVDTPVCTARPNFVTNPASTAHRRRRRPERASAGCRTRPRVASSP